MVPRFGPSQGPRRVRNSRWPLGSQKRQNRSLAERRKQDGGDSRRGKCARSAGGRLDSPHGTRPERLLFGWTKLQSRPRSARTGSAVQRQNQHLAVDMAALAHGEYQAVLAGRGRRLANQITEFIETISVRNQRVASCHALNPIRVGAFQQPVQQSPHDGMETLTGQEVESGGFNERRAWRSPLSGKFLLRAEANQRCDHSELQSTSGWPTKLQQTAGRQQCEAMSSGMTASVRDSRIASLSISPKASLREEFRNSLP